MLDVCFFRSNSARYSINQLKQRVRFVSSNIEHLISGLGEQHAVRNNRRNIVDKRERARLQAIADDSQRLFGKRLCDEAGCEVVDRVHVGILMRAIHAVWAKHNEIHALSFCDRRSVNKQQQKQSYLASSEGVVRW